MHRARSLRFSLLVVAGLLVGCEPPDDSALDAGPFDAPGLDGGGRDLGDVGTAPSDARPDTPDASGSAPIYRVLTGQDDDVVVAHALSETDGSLTELGRTDVAGGPGWIDVAPAGLDGVVALAGTDQVVALSLARGTGVVTELGARRSSEGGGPTHASIDRSGRWAFVANYGGGTIAAYPFGPGVGLGASSDTAAPGVRAHQILATPSNDWVLVPCLGSDHVAVLAFDAAAGTFRGGSTLDTVRRAGPRHAAISADGSAVYLTNELNSTVQALAFDEATGTLTSLGTVSSLPAGFGGTNSTAEIRIHPNERFVYVSNRGHDSIAIFAVEASGMLTPLGHALLMARTPRSFAIDPRGRWLLAGAQMDDVVVSFRIEADGMLTRMGISPTTGAPTFVGIFAVAP